MKKERFSFRWALAAMLAFLVMGTQAAQLDAQKSTAGGVTVAVTPRDLSSSSIWDFQVVLDTHSQDLSDDLVKSAVLLDDKGVRHEPVSWKGAGPGGHHREGVLSFKPLGGDVGNIELRIQRPGEPSPRSFRWQLR